MDFKTIEDNQEIFWEGKQNIFIRLITYATVGVNQINNYKYIAAAIFGVYYTLKLTNPWWLIGMTAVSLPLLILLGRWWLHRGAKASEFVTTQKGTVIGYGAYNLSIEQVRLLNEILKTLQKPM